MTAPDPVTWLRTAIEARKAIALKATPGPWKAEGDDPTDDEVWIGLDDDDSWRVAILRGDESHENMLHVAANDPQDTIARCEAELAILDEHGPSEVAPDACRCCKGGMALPCHTVRLLAGGYRNRPGYEDHWGAAQP